MEQSMHAVGFRRSITTTLVRISRDRLRPALNIVRPIKEALVPSVAPAPGLVRRTVAPVATAAARLLKQASTTILNSKHHDRLRQGLNVVLSISPVLAAYVGSVTGSNDNITALDPATTPPIVPAEYAFAIWGPIYASSIAYAIYQALPAQRGNELLRRIGWLSACTFFATTTWIIAAQNQLSWLTVVCIVWMLASLVAAFVQLLRFHAPRTSAEQYLVVFPISIFMGWVTVATIANIASVLKQYGISPAGLSDTTWAVVMLVAAGLIGSFVTQVSRGNVWYALTIIWALIGIVVANMNRDPNMAVALTAGGTAVFVALALARARTVAHPAS